MAGVRLALILGLIFALLPLFILLRLIERGGRGGASLGLTRFAYRCGLRLAGLSLHLSGNPLSSPGAIVSNHSSWLDILAIGAVHKAFFVARADVGRWPFIAPLARLAGTIFIERRASAARTHVSILAEQLAAHRTVALFPEGTSSDGGTVLTFKPTLFEAFFCSENTARLPVQPVTLRYLAPPHKDPLFYGWWGSMDLVPHILQVLSARRGGRILMTCHPPLRGRDFAHRKDLAARCEAIIRDQFLAHVEPEA